MRWPMVSSMPSSASAWGTVRGKPASRNPPAQSVRVIRSRIISTMTSSGTSSPRFMNSRALRPSSVPRLTSSRRMSPVEIWGMPYSRVRKSACVPLPLPGGPNSNRFTASSDEAAVLAHDQLGFELLHGVERDADHDQDGGAPEVHLLLVDAGDPGGGDRQHDCDHAQEDRAREGDAVQHRIEVVRRRAARADAGN